MMQSDAKGSFRFASLFAQLEPAHGDGVGALHDLADAGGLLLKLVIGEGAAVQFLSFLILESKV